jgi:serine/threonine-protein kinase HipA
VAALELDVFFEGMAIPAGRLRCADDGATSFRYLTDDLPHSLSLSLPVRE